MIVKTLIIGLVPLADTGGKKPNARRNDEYFKDLLEEFDFGEVHYALSSDWESVIDDIDPFVVIAFSEYEANQVKNHKKDCLLYVTYDPGQIFYRKAETEIKKEEQRKTFAEIAHVVAQIRNGNEEGAAVFRKFAGMSHDDLYDVITQALISKDEKLRAQAWALLNDNNANSNLIWMRAQLICEIWNHGDGKGKEEFLCMAMDQHIENGIARKMPNFTEDEQEFHQYMWRYFDGTDANYIRRIPVGFKGQDKYGYEAILRKFDTPNGPQVMLEAGHMRKQKEEYIKGQCAKFAAMLRIWKTDPSKPMRELGVIPWYPYTEDDPLAGRELEGFKDFLRKHDKAVFDSIFSS